MSRLSRFQLLVSSKRIKMPTSIQPTTRASREHDWAHNRAASSRPPNPSYLVSLPSVSDWITENFNVLDAATPSSTEGSFETPDVETHAAQVLYDIKILRALPESDLDNRNLRSVIFKTCSVATAQETPRPPSAPRRNSNYRSSCFR